MVAIHSKPDTLTRLANLGNVTAHEPAADEPEVEMKAGISAESPDCGSCVHNEAQNEVHSEMGFISHVTTPTGKKPIFKTMQTTACERNCYYCFFRAGRSKTPRETFSPDDMAKAFDTVQRAKLVDGIFLSSGIVRGGITAQDKILDTAELIRRKYQYHGYVHLKIMPGAEYDQIKHAMQLADRVSLNLEAPTGQRLNALAPKKHFFDELLTRLQWVEDIRRENPHLQLASSTTQFVVGAVGDTDVELLTLSEKLYRQMKLKRTYFMSFSPVEETPFENLPRTDSKRQLRLYQAAFLLRDYGWTAEDMPFLDTGNLSLEDDPKRAWAELHLRHMPVELMTADREQLLQIPGIGHRAVNTIIRARQKGVLRDISQLRQLGIRVPERAAPYILLNGQRPPIQTRMPF